MKSVSEKDQQDTERRGQRGGKDIYRVTSQAVGPSLYRVLLGGHSDSKEDQNGATDSTAMADGRERDTERWEGRMKAEARPLETWCYFKPMCKALCLLQKITKG